MLLILGMHLGGLYSDPLMSSSAQRVAARQRWTPTTMQLQILEAMFNQGNGTPTKQKIKQITGELSQHGQISESNVYNWFQNRRARSKKKQSTTVALTCNTESSEVEADEEEESPDEKKPRHSYHQQSIMPPLSIDHEVHSLLAPQPNQTLGVYRCSNDGLRSSGTLEHSNYENILSMPSRFIFALLCLLHPLYSLFHSTIILILDRRK